jgi:hypothetical protein
MRDRSAFQRAEIEITPQMIEAGVRVLFWASVGGDVCETAREVVADVLFAALQSSDMYRSGRLRLRLTQRFS